MLFGVDDVMLVVDVVSVLFELYGMLNWLMVVG